MAILHHGKERKCIRHGDGSGAIPNVRWEAERGGGARIYISGIDIVKT